jgi:hypothetical protein
MIYPWGYTSASPADVAAFKEWSDELTRDNGYLAGQAPNVLYAVSGEFNDWCYGDTLAKPRMYSWTPEVGSDVDNFWPAPSRIVPLAQENLRACYVVAAIAGPYVQEAGLSIAEGAMNAGHLAHLSVTARNLGITGAAGPGLTGTMSALDAGAHVLRATVSFPTLASRQSGVGLETFQVAIDDTVTPGRLLRFQIDFTDPAGHFSRDTVVVPAGTPTVLLADGASAGMGLWAAQTQWGIVATDPEHPSRYFADSPTGSYPANLEAALRLTQTFDFSNVLHDYALFEARWDYEPDYDAAFVEASPNGTVYTPLASTGTTLASGIAGGKQPTAGQHLFAGSRKTWKRERADLSPLSGSG